MFLCIHSGLGLDSITLFSAIPFTLALLYDGIHRTQYAVDLVSQGRILVGTLAQIAIVLAVICANDSLGSVDSTRG